MQKPEIRMLILSKLKCNPLKSEITYALKHLQKVIWNDFIQKKKKTSICIFSADGCSPQMLSK